MNDKAAKRRAIADKLAADIACLKKEIADRRANMAKARARAFAWAKPHNSGWLAVPSGFAAWSRAVRPLASAIGRLARAEKRLPGASGRAQDAETQARERAAIRQRIEKANIGYMQRLDALKEGAAAYTKQLKKERRAEERRVNRMKAILAARTGYTATPDWLLPPLPLPPPIEQPDLSIADPTEPPPREDLLPGTFRLMPLGALLDEKPRPDRWTWEYVGERLIEAHAVYKRLPASIWPKGYGGAWPSFQTDPRDLAEAEAPTRTVIRGGSAEEIARANEAITWPMQFLSAEEWRAQDVNHWAMQTTLIDEAKAPVGSLEIIADCLNAAGEKVR